MQTVESNIWQSEKTLVERSISFMVKIFLKTSVWPGAARINLKTYLKYTCGIPVPEFPFFPTSTMLLQVDGTLRLTTLTRY